MRLSGFFLSLPNMPGHLAWLARVSFVRYGFAGTMQAVYGAGRPRLVSPAVGFKAYPSISGATVTLEL